MSLDDRPLKIRTAPIGAQNTLVSLHGIKSDVYLLNSYPESEIKCLGLTKFVQNLKMLLDYLLFRCPAASLGTLSAVANNPLEDKVPNVTYERDLAAEGALNPEKGYPTVETEMSLSAHKNNMTTLQPLCGIVLCCDIIRNRAN